MPAPATARPDRERIVYVHSDTARTSSGGSASVRSPLTSGSSRSSEESWSDLGEDDSIDPSDSASHSRRVRSRRHTVEVRDPPTRHSSRRIPSREEESPPPRRREPRRHISSHSRHESRPARSHSRRVPSDGSTDSVADDYPPYGHHGMPPAAPYPPRPNGYRPQAHGGYPPSMASAGFHDPYNPQALMHLQRQDPFGHPGQQQNPFATTQPTNPFSPISTDGSGYFDPMAQPMHQRPPPQQRPQSFAAAPGFYGHELMPAYPQGFPAYGFSQHMMPPHGWHPGSQGSSPAPRDEEPSKALMELEMLKATLQKSQEEHAKAVEEQRKAFAKAVEDAKPKPPKPVDPEIEAQRAMLTRLQEDVLKAQKLFQEEREAELKAKAAAKAREEEEKKRKAEIAEASKKAKEDAEKKAADAAAKLKDEQEKAAAKAKEEWDKKLAQMTADKEKADKEKKALEEEAAKNKPQPDMLKKPIKFKDAVGRTFSFPWHLCKTWKGMEGLIKQAFLHVDLIGEHVHAGHYDLTGPDGEIILPQVWDTMVQPEWDITMHLWPMPEEEAKKDKLARDAEALHDPFANLGFDMGLGPPPGPAPKKEKKKDRSGSKSGKHKGIAHDMVVVPPHVGPADPFAALGRDLPPGIAVLPDEKPPKRPSGSKRRSTNMSGFQAWVVGGSRKPSRK